MRKLLKIFPHGLSRYENKVSFMCRYLNGLKQDLKPDTLNNIIIYSAYANIHRRKRRYNDYYLPTRVSEPF